MLLFFFFFCIDITPDYFMEDFWKLWYYVDDYGRNIADHCGHYQLGVTPYSIKGNHSFVPILASGTNLITTTAYGILVPRGVCDNTPIAKSYSTTGDFFLQTYIVIFSGTVGNGWDVSSHGLHIIQIYQPQSIDNRLY